MKDAILSLIAQGGPTDRASFERHALALYDWQIAHNAAYARFAAGARPRRWTEIPAVPVTLFRDVPLRSFAPAHTRVTFHTSGTTGSAPGVHHLADTDVLDAAARRAVADLVGTLPPRAVMLVGDSPHSSLAHMCRTLHPDVAVAWTPEGGVDVGATTAALAGPGAGMVYATAFAFADLLDALTAPITVAAGSMAMITGGFKGRRTSVPLAELAERARHMLPGLHLLGEYGMTELSSQLWAPTLGAPYRPPPWLAAYTVDPWTADPAPTGLLRFVDLANHQSVLAIETEDLGVVAADGAVTVEGRLAGAPARGCSLTVEEARWTASSPR